MHGRDGRHFNQAWKPQEVAATGAAPHLHAHGCLDVGHSHRVDGGQPASPQVSVVVSLYTDAPGSAVADSGRARACAASCAAALGCPCANLWDGSTAIM